MDQKAIFLIILGMALVTYGPRLAPAWLLSRRQMNPLLIRWLSFVPVAVLAALLLPGVLAPEGRVDVSWGNIFLWATVPCLILALRTKSFFGTVALGMLLIAGFRFFMAGG